MSERSQIIAVDDIELESKADARDELIWFYAQLIGLHDATEENAEALRFRSHEFELRIRLVPEPKLEPLHVRLHLWVASLSAIKTELRDRRIAFEEHHGITGTDRRIHLLDPGGNRVEIRQGWHGAGV